MKCVSLIFILCLSFLAWQPALNLTAKDVFRSFSTAEQTKFQINPESEESDDCAEFCVCSSNESAEADVNSTLSNRNKTIVLTEKIIENSYRKHYSRKFPKSIWQPPKNNSAA